MTVRQTIPPIASGPDSGKDPVTGSEWYWAWDTQKLYHLESGAYVAAAGAGLISAGGGSSSVGAWTNLTFSGGASAASGYYTPRCRLENGDTVRLSGGITVPTAGVISTLGASYRPTQALFPIVASVGVGASAVGVNTSGQITAYAAGTYVLDGCTFTIS